MEQMTLFGEPEKIDDRFREYEEKIEYSKKVLKVAADISQTYYKKPLVVTYSGGKDSDVMLDLAIKSGIDFEALHSVTTVDAPETNRHVNKVFSRLRGMGIKAEKSIPMYKGRKTNMWKQIEERGIPPTRLARYCCDVLKEGSTQNRMIAIGVRKAESVGRVGRSDFATRGKVKREARWFNLDHAEKVFDDAKRISEELNKPIEEEDVYDCTLIRNAKANNELICYPIYDFTDVEVWRYIRQNQIEVNPLYDKGFKRVGCLGCPLGGARQMRKEFAMYPHTKELYIKAFDRMMEKRREKGKDDVTGKEGFHKWETGQDVFDWWMNSQDSIYGQTSLFEDVE